MTAPNRPSSSSILSPAERLADILRTERRALLDGRFHALPDLTEIKTALARQMTDAAQPADIRAVRLAGRIAAGNLRLIDAARKGLRDASRRIEMIFRAGKSLETYDALGRSSAARLAEVKVERRA
jgi:hypothetical protein